MTQEISNDENEMHVFIKEALDNNLYGLNAEEFFLEKIILPISQSRSKKSTFRTTNHNRVEDKNADKDLLKDYFKYISTPLIPTQELLDKINFLTESKNSDLCKELNNNIHKLFSLKFTMWAINNSSHNLSEIIVKAFIKKLNFDHYKMQDIIDNIAIMTNEDKKSLLVSKLYLTTSIASYSLLDKEVPLNAVEKKKVVEEILIKNTSALLLNRDLIKEIFMSKVEKKQWNVIDTYLRSLNINKLDFLLDILLESKKETNDVKEIEKINRAIYQTIDKAFYIKNPETIERAIQIKREIPEITKEDMYILMIKRCYSYLKKEKAQKYFEMIMAVAKENGDREKIKNILFTNQEKYLIKSLDVEIGLKDDYFKKEMKQHFMGYLQDKLPEKNTTTKPKKI